MYFPYRRWWQTAHRLAGLITPRIIFLHFRYRAPDGPVAQSGGMAARMVPVSAVVHSMVAPAATALDLKRRGTARWARRGTLMNTTMLPRCWPDNGPFRGDRRGRRSFVHRLPGVLPSMWGVVAEGEMAGQFHIRAVRFRDWDVGALSYPPDHEHKFNAGNGHDVAGACW